MRSHALFKSIEAPSTLQKTSPSKTYYYGSLPCEKKVAELRNQAVTAIEQEDIAAVAFLFLKNRAGLNYTSAATRDFALMLVMLELGLESLMQPDAKGSTFVNQSMSILLILFSAYALGYLLPNFKNNLEYKKTTSACELWLRQRLDEQTLSSLKKIQYTPTLFKESLAETEKLLSDHGVDVTQLQSFKKR